MECLPLFTKICFTEIECPWYSGSQTTQHLVEGDLALVYSGEVEQPFLPVAESTCQLSIPEGPHYGAC